MKVDPVLVETLEALEMPREGLLRWIRRSRERYCLNHGGRKYYAELMDLYDEILDERSECEPDRAKPVRNSEEAQHPS